MKQILIYFAKRQVRTCGGTGKGFKTVLEECYLEVGEMTLAEAVAKAKADGADRIDISWMK